MRDFSIGDLARRTGLTVKAIRFYSDRGLVPPTRRDAAGNRRYGVDAVARLDLLRTLRELGIDLATIRRVLDREVALADVAAAHAGALAVQIRTLRLRRAVLTAVAKRGSTPEEMELMHKLARMSEDERARLVGEFLESVFGGLDGFAGVARSMTPQLPDEPDAEQVEAWVELAELTQDPDFRASMRRLAERHAADRAGHRAPVRDAVAIVRDRVRPALAAGVDPASPEAGGVVARVTAQYARAVGRAEGPALLRDLLARLDAASDPRRERYLRLLSVVNGWSTPESTAASLDWFVRAVRAAG